MSVEPARYNFKAYCGATFRKQLTLYQGDRDSDPKDLTGYTAEFEVKAKASDTSTLLTLTQADGITLGGVAGTIVLFISADDTDSFSWKNGFYDLTITGPGNGDTDLLLYGTFTLINV